MTTLAEVKIVTAGECGCEFRDRQIAHDRLLGIEALSVPYAGLLIADLISGIDPGTGNERGLFGDPDDFDRFVTQHNWVDPVGMAALGEAVDTPRNQSWTVDFGKRCQGQRTC
jgi:hypothetical protein